MNLPQTASEIRDPRKNITYRILAYRPLTREEMVLAVRAYLANKRTKAPKAGETVIILSVLGLHDQ